MFLKSVCYQHVATMALLYNIADWLKTYDHQRDKCFSGAVKYILAYSAQICRLISLHPTRLPNVPCLCMSICILANISGLSLSSLLTLNPDIVIVSCLVNCPPFSSNQTSAFFCVHVEQTWTDLLKWVAKCWLSICQERPFNELNGLGSRRNQRQWAFSQQSNSLGTSNFL